MLAHSPSPSHQLTTSSMLSQSPAIKLRQPAAQPLTQDVSPAALRLSVPETMTLGSS